MADGAGTRWTAVRSALVPFFLSAAFAVLETAAISLVLVHSGLRVLPLLYVATALLSGPAAALALTRGRARALPPAETVAWIVVFGALAAADRPGAGAVAALPALALYVAANVGAARLWARLLALREQAGDTLGRFASPTGLVAGGSIAALAGPALGASGLVPAGCALLAAALGTGLRTDETTSRKATRAPVHPPGRTDLEEAIAAVAVVMGALGAAADYVFRAAALRASAHGPPMLVVFGWAAAATGALAIAVRAGPVAGVLRRGGLFAVLLSAPVAALAAAVAAVTGALVPAAALRVVQGAAALPPGRGGLRLATAPLADSARRRSDWQVATMAVPAGWALGGLLLLFGGSANAAAVGYAAAGAALVPLLRKRYLAALGERLNSGVGEEPPDLHNASSRRMLALQLASPEEGRVLTALALLARDPHADMDGVLDRLLSHASERVRTEAARLAGERGCSGCAGSLVQHALLDRGAARQAAVFAVARVRPYTAARLLEPLLTDADFAIRTSAVSALLPLDPTGAAGKALESILAEGRTGPPERRAQVARLLGRLGAGMHARRLRDFLRDEDVSVRRAACEAAGESADMELVDELIERLRAHETRPAARAALIRCGDAISDRLETLLSNRAEPDLRTRVPRILRGIATPRALGIALGAGGDDDPLTAYRLSVAADAIAARRPGIAVDAERVHAAASRRLDACEALAPTADDLTAALGMQHLLVRAVHGRVDQHLEGAVRLSALVCPRRPLLNAYNRLVFGDEATRPLALELLGQTLEPPLGPRLLEQLAQRHRGAPDDGRASQAPARLRELSHSGDALLAALASATVRRLAGSETASSFILHPSSFILDPSCFIPGEVAVSGAEWDELLREPPEPREEGPVGPAVVEKILFLQGVDIFADSDVDDLSALAQQVRERTLAAGEVVYHRDDPGDALFVVVEGRVSIEKDGRRIVELGPRQSFGETSLLDGLPRPATARAVTDVRLLALERADFMDMVSDRVELLRGIFTAVTKHLRSLIEVSAAGRITNPTLTPISIRPAGR